MTECPPPPWMDPDDSPWRRLIWTTPAALSLWLAGGALFISWLHQGPKPLPPLPPVVAELVELPPPPRAKPSPPQRETPPPTPRAVPHSQPTAPVPHLPAPPATPPSPPAAAASPTPPAPPPSPPTSGHGAQENHGARAMLKPLPAIPDDLRQEALDTSATVRFRIATDGSVQVELLRATQNPRLNRLLLESLQHWRFFPAVKDGIAIDSTQDLEIQISVK